MEPYNGASLNQSVQTGEEHLSHGMIPFTVLTGA